MLVSCRLILRISSGVSTMLMVLKSAADLDNARAGKGEIGFVASGAAVNGKTAMRIHQHFLRFGGKVVGGVQHFELQIPLAADAGSAFRRRAGSGKRRLQAQLAEARRVMVGVKRCQVLSHACQPDKASTSSVFAKGSLHFSPR